MRYSKAPVVTRGVWARDAEIVDFIRRSGLEWLCQNPNPIDSQRPIYWMFPRRGDARINEEDLFVTVAPISFHIANLEELACTAADRTIMLR